MTEQQCLPDRHIVKKTQTSNYQGCQPHIENYWINKRKLSFFFSLVLVTEVSQFVECLLANTLVFQTGTVRVKVILRRLGEATVTVEEQ